MKILYTLGVIALIASASTAQANDNAYPMGVKQQRIHNQAEYWHGKSVDSASIQKNADYDFAVTPQQRMAKRSAAYFAGKGGNSSATFTKILITILHPRRSNVPQSVTMITLINKMLMCDVTACP